MIRSGVAQQKKNFLQFLVICMWLALHTANHSFYINEILCVWVLSADSRFNFEIANVL